MSKPTYEQLARKVLRSLGNDEGYHCADGEHVEILASALESAAREGGERRDEAYEAFHWLNDNHAWAIRSLDVWMSKVNPTTGERTEKEEENTEHEYWLEGGPFDDEDQCFTNDVELDCGGDTFEEAIIKYAKRVKEIYGEKSELNGSASPKDGSES